MKNLTTCKLQLRLLSISTTRKQTLKISFRFERMETIKARMKKRYQKLEVYKSECKFRGELAMPHSVILKPNIPNTYCLEA